MGGFVFLALLAKEWPLKMLKNRVLLLLRQVAALQGLQQSHYRCYVGPSRIFVNSPFPSRLIEVNPDD